MKTNKKTKQEWNPYLPLSTLPKEIRKHFIKHANFLYEELRDNKLEVVLACAPWPYEDRNKIRMVENRPPRWFSEMYYSLKKSRKFTLKALERIINETDKRPKN